MARVRIITDATAHLTPDLIDRYQITVLPTEVQFGGERFVIGPGDSAKKLFKTMVDGPVDPIEASISSQALREAYARLNRETDEILVIPSSRQLSTAYNTALAEASAFLGRCQIAVTDSMSTSWGLGLIVETAARAAAEGKTLDQTVRLVRGVMPHIYVIFFVERLDYLEWGKRIGSAQARLGTMLRIRPLLMVEDGDIIPLEKLRTRGLAIEKLADFVAEFAAIQQVVILRSPLEDDVDQLRDKLGEQLSQLGPDPQFPVINYDPVLACHLGPNALGVTVYEGF
jgi:DegV family protein with EDD domain